MHGDAKSSVAGFFKGWLMKGSDGKWHVRIKEKKRDVVVSQKSWEKQPTYGEIVAWLKGVEP